MAAVRRPALALSLCALMVAVPALGAFAGGIFAAGPPQFTVAYVGAVEGHFTMVGGGERHTIDWKVSGLVLKKTDVIRTGALWTAGYKARAGRLSVEIRDQGGGCTYSPNPLRYSLDLATAPRELPVDATVTFDLGRWSFDASLSLKEQGHKRVVTCPNQEPQSFRVALSDTEEVFAGGQAGGRPGRPLIGHSVYRHRNLRARATETTTVSWRLLPR